jgi:mono/diheme cytochrome c family protein
VFDPYVIVSAQIQYFHEGMIKRQARPYISCGEILTSLQRVPVAVALFCRYFRLSFPGTDMAKSFPYIALLVIFIFTGCRETPRAERQSTTTDTLGTAENEPRDPIERGRIAYANFCASCHGLDGAGDGPVAEYLTIPLDDLRRLKAQHGGTFPVDLVYETIDGRDDVRAHGTRVMPVWGNVWTEHDGSPMPQEYIEKRINEIVEYVRSIQVNDNGGTPTT